MKKKYDVIIVGSGPAGLGAAFHLAENSNRKILLIDKARISSGGLRNDCKQNYTFPVGFQVELWKQEEANRLLDIVARHLKPKIQKKENIDIYKRRSERLGVRLIDIQQAHVGTDKAVHLINRLIDELQKLNVDVSLETEADKVDLKNRQLELKSNGHSIEFQDLILAPGRAAFGWLQEIMRDLEVSFLDNIVDIGIRLELKEENYSIVRDYYDPKFIFPGGVRTFCTNSGRAKVVREKYDSYYSINGHSLSASKSTNGLVNFALLKTITLTEPVVSGHEFATILGQMAMQLSGGTPMMQRIGDFRMGMRSRRSTFNEDLYDFKPTLNSSLPADVSLAIPAKIMRDLWRSLKMLDTIVPGVLHPSTIIYYPEIKTYANRPEFLDNHFQVKKNIYMIGDGAGTSRGITGAWSSGIRAAEGILKK